MSERELLWGDDDLSLTIEIDEIGRARLTRFAPGSGDAAPFESSLPLVEIVTTSRSKTSGTRYDGSELGLDLRYETHRDITDGGARVLEVDLRDPSSPLVATVRYAMRPGSGVVSSSSRLFLRGAGSVAVLFVSSFVLGDSRWNCDDSVIHLADNDWLAESRWRSGTFEQLGEPEVDMAAHGGAAPRGGLTLMGRGTWSTGEHLPMGALVAPDGSSLLWQIESNAGWRWQLAQSSGARLDGVLRLVASGPTDAEHNWSVVLAEHDSFTTPVTTVAVSTKHIEDAVARLTGHRRADHHEFAGDASLPVIYNDYMNTLMADPTTEKLIPLITAVGRTGSDIFIVDAGWYSDEPSWWGTVGAWTASTTRFPGGFDKIFDEIRANGMIPGLWLEPEVVGVDSPIATQLPDEAFYMRHGTRLAENGRYQLDFRHPAASAHLDGVLDRLIAEYGLGYVKFDYNINPASGTDRLESSPGAGMLAASRSYLDWIDRLHARHPQLIIENCASGGMRADWLSMSHFALLSTSDQQDELHCVPIAASSTMLVPPEWAGVWSYPQHGMSPERTTVTLANSLLRRPILSGRLDLMTDDELAIVRGFVTAHKGIRELLPRLQSTWPLGLPAWEDPWVAAGLVGTDVALLTVWRRGGEPTAVLPLDRLLTSVIDPVVEQVFPAGQVADWEFVDGGLRVALDAPGAVVLKFTSA